MAITRSAIEVVWDAGIPPTPPGRLYGAALECFNHSSGCPAVIQGDSALSIASSVPANPRTGRTSVADCLFIIGLILGIKSHLNDEVS